MQVQIKAAGDGIGYAKKEAYEYEGKNYEADIQNGDKIKVLNAGAPEEGNFGTQIYFKIQTRNGEKKAPFNQSSINLIAEAHGTETENWIGKELNVLTKKGVFAGKKGIATYFVTEGWSLDDYGDLVKEGALARTKNEVAEEVINPSDIPF